MTRILFWVTCVCFGLWLAGCGDNLQADPCFVPPTSSIGYVECTATCVASCGELPGDGTPGHLLAPGCTVQIGTSDTHAALCVADCSECK